MRPDRRLLRPARVGVARAELLRRGAERGRIVQRLVARHASPVERFRGGLRLRVGVDDGRELLPGLSEETPAEFRVSQAEPELRQKVVSRQEAFDPVFLVARVVEDQGRRRPPRVEPPAQFLELLRLFLHVNAHGHEVRRDEFSDAGLGVHLGIQPSTPGSKRGGAEVEQHVHVSTAGLGQRLVQIVKPRDWCGRVGHECLPEKADDSARRAPRPPGYDGRPSRDSPPPPNDGHVSHLISRGRGVAQPGRAPALGAGSRRFESCLPDQFF